MRDCWLADSLWGVLRLDLRLVSLLSFISNQMLTLDQGAAYLISQYYKRHEFQIRYSLFFSATQVGGAFGGVSYILIFELQAELTFVVSRLRFGKDGWNCWLQFLEMVSQN